MLANEHWNRRTVNFIVNVLSVTIQRFLKVSPGISVRAVCAYWLIFASVLLVFSVAAIAEVTQVTTADGITVNFKLPQLHVAQVKPDSDLKSVEASGVYHTARYLECDWLQEPGHPKLPVTRVLLAIPSDARLSNADISVNTGATQTRSGVQLLQNKKETNSNSSSKLYPAVLARIEMDGKIRSQRVISLALHPVHYNAATRELRSYSSLTVFIPFKSQLATRATDAAFKSASASLNQTLSPFKRTFTQHIFNYADYRQVFNVDLERARTLQSGMGSLPSAPAAPGLTDKSLQTRYKLYIDETGIYKVTAASLRTDWGIDLIGVDPRKIRLTHGDQEIPIYISGAVDGRLDAKDAIFS